MGGNEKCAHVDLVPRQIELPAHLLPVAKVRSTARGDAVLRSEFVVVATRHKHAAGQCESCPRDELSSFHVSVVVDSALHDSAYRRPLHYTSTD